MDDLCRVILLLSLAGWAISFRMYMGAIRDKGRTNWLLALGMAFAAISAAAYGALALSAFGVI